MDAALYRHPLPPALRREVAAFLEPVGVRLEAGLEVTAILREDGRIVATGSRQEGVLKCIGVAAGHQGQGLAAALVTALYKDALAAGHRHLFIYTGPENLRYFGDLGFYQVARAADAALLENIRGGIENFLAGCKAPGAGGTIGCIVANGNPFTSGHLYLAEYAASQCDFLYYFVLSEEKSAFSATARLAMARAALAPLENVQVCPTGSYLVSAATFPTYFLKEHIDPKAAFYDLDIAVFGQRFVPALGIGTRFVGTEPRDEVTQGYNRRMAALLPDFGVRFVELPRLEMDGEAVSASAVRRLLRAGDRAAALRLVPPAVRDHIEAYAKNNN